MLTRRETIRKECSGSVLLEAAVVLPIFLMFVIGMIGFGQVSYKRLVATIALQEVARIGERNLTSEDLAMFEELLRSKLQRIGIHDAVVALPDEPQDIGDGILVYPIKLSFDVSCIGCALIGLVDKNNLHSEFISYYQKGT